MCKHTKPKIAIIDYGMGNLFSVKRACEYFNADGAVTCSDKEILDADGVILPGVGAFGDAMDMLGNLGLIRTLQEIASSSKPLMGICLGMQLLMQESFEFGRNEGLGLIDGSVVKFEDIIDNSGKRLKVPHVGWNQIYPNKFMQQGVLKDTDDGEFMYFNHSFYVKLDNPQLGSAISYYGDMKFCSSIQYKNIYGCQFHPERSGKQGLKIYDRFISLVKEKTEGR